MADQKKSKSDTELSTDTPKEDVADEAVKLDGQKDTVTSSSDEATIDQNETDKDDLTDPIIQEDPAIDNAPDEKSDDVDLLVEDSTSELDRTKTEDAQNPWDTPDTDDETQEAVVEEIEDAKSERPVEEPQEKVVERVVERRRGGLPAIFGGIVAAILGFLVASTDLIAPYLPESLRPTDIAGTVAELEQQVVTQAERIDALTAQVEGIDIPDLSGLEAQIGDTSEQVLSLQPDLQAVADQLATLETRLSELETQPLTEGVSDEAIAAYERELEAVRESFAAERAQIEAMVAEAQATEQAAAETARLTAARGALNQVQSALETGAPFVNPLSAVAEADIEVPAVLSGNADKGIVSLSALQASFPGTARNALAAARSEEGPDGGLGGFLARQLGARSVTPQEGDTADAVLSRMEGALANGQLEATVELATALPQSAQDIFSDWMSQAETRLAALAAADDLAQRLTTN